MSLVTLQLGQCGNQIGGKFFQTITDDLTSQQNTGGKHHNDMYVETGVERFFNERDSPKASWEARAVMVDMEPKVIAQTLSDAKHSGKWRYPKDQQYCQQRGSGNNWAHGFCTHGPRSKDTIMNLVRKEVEKCDHFEGFLTFLSLAGGTGSGVGTYLTHCLREEYPDSFILNQVVWPYRMGEVIVQNYNAVLTLSHLYQSVDALLVVENDDLHKICMQRLALKNVSFKDINKVICHKLAAIFLPCYHENQRDYPIRSHLGEMLEHVVPHPDYKILTLRNIPLMSEQAVQYSTYAWHGLLKHLRQMLIASAAMEEGIDWQVKASGSNTSFNKSLSNLLFLRGADSHQTDFSAFTEKQLYTSWAPPACAFTTWSHPRPLNMYEKSAALLTNSQSAVKSLDHMVGKAWNMFASRAYVHQYKKHGVTEADFIDSFATLEQVIHSYKNLS